MWVFTEQGEFYSAVNYRTKKSIRTRDERSAVRLAEFVEKRRRKPVEIAVGAGTDYQWRVTLTRAEWKAFMNDRIDSAQATNVKSEVARNLGYKAGKKFLDAMHDTWSVWFSYQQDQLGEKRFWQPEEEEVENDDKAWFAYQQWASRDQ